MEAASLVGFIKSSKDLVFVYFAQDVTLDAHNIRLVIKECKIKQKLLVPHQALFIMMFLGIP